jgi:hypothetical protein
MKAVTHSTRCHDSKYQDFSDVSVAFKMIFLSWVLLQCSQKSHGYLFAQNSGRLSFTEFTPTILCMSSVLQLSNESFPLGKNWKEFFS